MNTVGYDAMVSAIRINWFEEPCQARSEHVSVISSNIRVERRGRSVHSQLICQLIAVSKSL